MRWRLAPASSSTRAFVPARCASSPPLDAGIRAGAAEKRDGTNHPSERWQEWMLHMRIEE